MEVYRSIRLDLWQRGMQKKKGIYYEETFAPVVRFTSIKCVISLVAQMGCEIHQIDVETTFLNGLIEEGVYIEQPEGFEIHVKHTHVWKLKKSLYGLKHAPRAWYGRIDIYMQ